MNINNKKTITKTFYLFAEPSFSEGFARIIDINNSLSIYHYSETAKDSDYLAIKNDWLQVGEDLNQSINSYGTTKFPTISIAK